MNLSRAALSAFGLGFIPKAPGTFGSLLPIVFAAIALTAHASSSVINFSLIAFGLAFSLACIILTSKAEQSSGKKDPGWIVADEVAGQSLALLLPWTAINQSANRSLTPWLLLIGAFILFRLFDITKPPPIRQSQNLPHGWGVLIDDLLAGALSLAILQLICRLWLLK
ncbi:MAG TPA: phosphatidylglycerophosphatase A [Phycisphaerales bacterium]|nr:phosphatidylglycerophosphatase A [Phycisphaerales bacterium]